MEQLSPAQILAKFSDEEREEYLKTLSPEVLAALRYHWEFWARPDQLAPKGSWSTWLILAGRGWGKSRVGAQWVIDKAKQFPGCRIALVGETAADARRVMIEGESGILSVSPPDFKPEYSPANRQLTWPNGSLAFTYNGTQPDQLRGPQHHFAWVDELAKFEKMQDSWDQLQFGLRLGLHPQQIVTTTPRPIGLIKKIMNDSSTVVTRGRTLDNADNLAQSTVNYLYDRYGGTRLGRQELEGEILEDIPGALWQRSTLDETRRREAPELKRIVVAVDPAVSSEEKSDETGIIVCGIADDADGYTRGYVLADRSIKGNPAEWSRAVVAAYREFDADRIVAEKNQGGEMVEHTIKAVDRNVPVTLVHASRGKVTRAEPISALYEQHRVHHVGFFEELETQMCEFSVDFDRKQHGSPDRLDALVWALTELFGKLTSRRKKAPDEEEYQLVDITGRPLRGERTVDTAWMI